MKKSEQTDNDGGAVHSIDGAVYTLRPEYGRHVPCFYCDCGGRFFGATWEEAGVEYDAHLNEEA